jgi:hypothetical protein
MNRSYVRIACCFCLFCPCLFTFLQNTYVICTQDIARWEAYQMAKPTTLQMLDWRPLPSDHCPFLSSRGLFVPVLLRVGTVHPPPRFIVALTTHQRRAPQPLLRPSWAETTTCITPSVSLHLYPSTLPLTLSWQEMDWAGQGWGVRGRLKPCWLQSYRISKFSILFFTI